MAQLLKDIMTSNVETISPMTNIRQAAEKMKKMNVGVLPVCDGEKLLGTVTDRDIAIRAVSESRNMEQTKVHDIMTAEPEFCYEDDSVDKAARLMQSKQIRRIVILDRSQKVAGILSLGDIATETRNVKLAGKTLREVSREGGQKGSEEGMSQSEPNGVDFNVRPSVLAALGIFAGAAALVGGVRYLSRTLQQRKTENYNLFEEESPALRETEHQAQPMQQQAMQQPMQPQTQQEPPKKTA